MLGSFLKKRKNIDFSKPVLLIDVRSASVGGAIVQFSDKHIPFITSISREHYFFEKAVDGSEFITRTEIALKKVLENLLHKGKNSGAIGSVQIFYGSPWYKTFITNVQIEEITPTIFDEEFLNRLIKQEKSSVTPEEALIEKEIISIVLNGYRVTDPFGKNATHFDLSFYLSILNKETKDGFDSIIKKHTHIDSIHSHTHPYAMFTALNSKFHNPKNYVILDINGEITEMTIVKDEHFKKIVAIPYGSHSFVRSLAEITKTDFKTALIHLKTILSNKTDGTSPTPHDQFLKQIKTDWIAAIQKSIKESKIEIVPYEIFVSGDDEIKDIILNILNDVEVYAGALKIGRKPNVQFIASDVIKDFCSYKEKPMKIDHQLATEAVFVELLRAHQ